MPDPTCVKWLARPSAATGFARCATFVAMQAPPAAPGVTYAAVIPPSTRKVALVVKEDSSVARKRTARAISFASPPCCAGGATGRQGSATKYFGANTYSQELFRRAKPSLRHASRDD